MLDAKEIEKEIARLEYIESSYANYSKLADLYTIQNQMNKTAETKEYPNSAVSAIETEFEIGYYDGSDFMQAISGKDAYEIWRIIDDLMGTLQVVNTKAYNRIMNRIYDA